MPVRSRKFVYDAKRKKVVEVKEITRPQHLPQYPILSDAMGVMPQQVGEATALARQKGVNTKYTEDGRAILTSREHRKRHAEAFGFYDRNGGYGDAAPRHYTGQNRHDIENLA